MNITFLRYYGIEINMSPELANTKVHKCYLHIGSEEGTNHLSNVNLYHLGQLQHA